MIKEIVNYVNEFPPELFSQNLTLGEGLYVFVDIDTEGNLISYEANTYKKSAEMNPFFQKCLTRFTNSSMLTSNKRYNQSFEIGTPFGIGFKKNILFENVNNKTNKKSGYSNDTIKKKINEYFEVAKCFLNKNDPNHLIWFTSFSEFCRKELINFSNNLLSESKAKAIFIFHAKASNIDFELTYNKYLIERGAFNKPKLAKELNGKKYQISDTLNDFGIQKIFLEHKTAPFNLNLQIESEDAVDILKFFKLADNNTLPNPCPIFIDKEELPDGLQIGSKMNKEIIRIIQSNENSKLSYSQIIKQIFDNPEYKSYLSDYYLLFFQFIPQKGKRVIDLDFVPSFQYELKNMKIFDIFLQSGVQFKKIDNLFEFEREITSKIFDNVMVSVYKDSGTTIRYFFDFKDKNSKSQIKGLIADLRNKKKNFNDILVQVLKYRKAFYDFVYKSKHEAIQDFMFHDIMQKSILDDIRSDEYTNEKHTKWYPIREKLNIWFSLYEYFNLIIINGKTMASRISEHLDMMQKIVKGEQTLQNDDEFAFAAGQVIAYLYTKSESADRSYSRLEPFLQKVDCIKLQEAIKNAFNTYKHKTFSNNFKKPFADVMDYRTQRNLQELMPTILAGFFAANALFPNDEVDTNNSDEENSNINSMELQNEQSTN